ncbi:MAG: CatA-like O-acetyltransferase, partial [bacterium]
MPSYLDIENWKRKAQFYFFKDYDYPFFNICTDVDVTSLVGYTKERNRSFFITSLYLSLKTVNEIAEFRYRIRGNKVVVHELIHGGSTVLNEDETFRFCYFAYHPTFKQFTREASRVLKQNPNTGRSLDPQDERDDLIHYSMIPWISFTSFSHARRFHCSDS